MSFPLPNTRWLLPCLASAGLWAAACADAPALEPVSADAVSPTAEILRELSRPSRYIIKYKSTVRLRSERGLAALAKQGAQVKVELEPQNAVAANLSPKLLTALRGNPDIEYIEPDPARVLLAQQVPFDVDRVQAAREWLKGSATRHNVCTIDSGLSVAPEDISASFSSSVVDGLNRCKASGATIVTLRLGGPFASTTEQDAFQAALNEGVLSIAALGNTGDTSPRYPASYPSVVSVAASPSIQLEAQAYAFSAFLHAADLSWSGAAGASVDIYRNGRKVMTTANDGMHSEWIWLSTSTTYNCKVCQAGSTLCSPTVTVTANTLP